MNPNIEERGTAFLVPYTSEADAVRAIDNLARNRDDSATAGLALDAVITILGIPGEEATDTDQLDLLEDVIMFWKAHNS